jgi:hypothetical protein
LFPMEEPIVVGQAVQVVNENSGKSIDCKVTTIRKARDGKTHVGVEFVAQNANFWQMCFPVPGTRPLRRTVSSKASA